MSADPTALPSIESLIVAALPDDDRRVLRRGAVLRSITPELAGVVTDSARDAQLLVEHPMLEARGRPARVWTMPEPLRRALVADWTDAADEVRARIAENTTGVEALYARLATVGTRAAALDELTVAFDAALQDGDVPRAHDLLRLLDEWPVDEDTEARALRDRLSPRLRRHSRALPDREVTASYLEREFEQPVWTLLLDDPHRWMLHLHAPGGRGKTMFVKNLLGRRCPDADIAVARIDFDYVARLGIATTEPWRLLLAVAAQLDAQLPASPFRFMLDAFGPLQDVVRPEALPRLRPSAGVNPTRVVDQLAIEAAGTVPLNFSDHLAEAAGQGHVVVALDTVENVLHTEGAELAPVLAAFRDIVHGENGSVAVPGLRLVVSGRFDLGEDRPGTGDPPQPRVPGFRERYLGPDVEERDLGDTKVRLGREVVVLEVPGFSPEEARRFLEAQRPAIDPDVIAAIVARTHDNPMKLALLAEEVRRNPRLTADDIAAIEDVDLFYLVDRVVDRIADGRVQWLLRWGALLPVITREALDEVLWPALDAFAAAADAARHAYDDARAGGVPRSLDGVSRWDPPALETVRHPEAREEAWRGLLDYTANASWISVVPDLPDTVVLHPEVRDPLRRLLRDAGLPVYDDIHQRSFAYWSHALESAEPALRTTAARALLFHAYEPWTGAEHDGDRLFVELLRRQGEDRAARGGLAREVLERGAGGGPSRASRELAHLELAEELIATAERQGVAVSEGTLTAHLNAIGELRSRARRRVAFAEAVLDEAAGQEIDAAWAALGHALDHPPPASDPAHLVLMGGWVASRTPPASRLDVARRLAAQGGDDRVKTAAAAALTRGLLAAERWPEAAERAELARSAELRGAALVGLGAADAVLADPDQPRLWRARARLLRHEPTHALLELGDDPTGDLARADELLVRGQALALLDRYDETSAVLSQAASGVDPVFAVEATLELARFLGRTGGLDIALSHLIRLADFTDPLVALRARLLAARLFRETGAFGHEQLVDAERLVETADVLPPSLTVELAVTRLAVRDVTEQRLLDLDEALRAVAAPGPRLLALRDLPDVAAVPGGVAPETAQRLRSLVESDGSVPAVVVLARAELERVLRDVAAAGALLDRAAALESDPAATLTRAVAQARDRLATVSPDPRSRSVGMDQEPWPAGSDGVFESAGSAADPGPAALRIGTGGFEGVGPAGLRSAVVPAALVADGAYALARSPEPFLGMLREVLAAAPPPSGDRSLHLYLTTEDAARLPWEAAADQPPGFAGVLRRRQPAAAADELYAVPPTVLVVVLDEHRDRGQPVSLLRSFYGPSVELVVARSMGAIPADLRTRSTARVVHVVADPVPRRRTPALRTAEGGHVTAESCAAALGDGPRLVVLDLALSDSDLDAAEQLMIANAFCWQLVRVRPELDVLCGVFNGLDAGRVRRLAEHLAVGDPLSAIAADLQGHRDVLPAGRHPLREVVSLSTDHPDRRYRLRGSP